MVITFLSPVCQSCLLRSRLTTYTPTKSSVHDSAPAAILIVILYSFRHSGALSCGFQWHPDSNRSGKEGHRLVDGQAREVQEPQWQQPYRGFPR